MIRIGQIGVGYWGPNLLRNLVMNNQCRVMNVADLSTERLKFVKSLYPSIDIEKSIYEYIYIHKVI